MQCSKCSNILQSGDRFCEECGAPVIATTLSTPGCEKCGALSEQIDADGFCSNCGFRRENRRYDGLDVELSPQLAFISDQGLKRHRNEDYVACAQVDHTNAYILVVCDGLSSSFSPEKAAQAAAQKACEVLTHAASSPNSPYLAKLASPQEVMKSAIAEARTSVCAIPYPGTTENNSPSTTIVAAMVVNRTATIGWLGDSRAYWISANGSQQLTTDDSWLRDVVLAGELSEVEARKSPHAHAITRWLGADAVNQEPSVVNFDIPGSGYLLLCTDGLWNYTPRISQFDAFVKVNTDAVTVARQLVEFALRSGGHDNISVAVLSL